MSMSSLSESTLEPLISCVMPTYNRRKFVPHAIRYFLRQEQVKKELIIVDDGADCIADLVPKHDAIRYIRLKSKITLGEKLNIACSNASGEIIAHWDDDDWYAAHRLVYQMNALVNGPAQVCGINNLLYYDLTCKKAFEYRYPQDQRTWLLGSSLCYYKSHWASHPFEKINVGMDGLFVWATSSSLVSVLKDPEISVHMIHEQNVSPKNTKGEWWHHYPVDKIKEIMKSDLNYYGDEAETLTAAAPHVNTTALPVQQQVKKIRNIYACLVHESLDCVIDLVRNLHYSDPASSILLFDGGSELHLHASLFPFEEFGASIHPLRNPVSYGYLHEFALECMELALDNFAFDTLTIVDSDQMSLRQGYSEFLSTFLANKQDVGLLSNLPQRLTAQDTQVWTSIKAFEEIELWRPLLRTYPHGEDKFVHWSFWPSTVFTYNAIKDLVKEFKTNKLLQYVMQHTRIWATEEIILPTMVSLLGYRIEMNPCCSDYVNYQREYALQELRSAQQKPNAIWIHPVARKYDDPVRRDLRQSAANYAKPSPRINAQQADYNLFLPAKALESIQEIKGWLTAAEADLLTAIALKACCTPTGAQLLEVGSYQGKATVLLGLVAKSANQSIKVYAVDPHDGILGSRDQGLHAFEPSYEAFMQNIRKAGLMETVVPVQSRSEEVDWDLPLSLLLIDGLHDYTSVCTDYRKFSPYLIPGGYIAFHDYAEYFPDVVAFVNEISERDNLHKVQLTDALMVLQKPNAEIE